LHFIGEDPIHRDDGVVVENHRVLMMGDHVPLNLDKGLLKYMRVINESR